MTVAETIRRKLVEALAPTHLEIIDESHQHVGHAGYREGGETHFRVEIASASFEGQSRVARQRTIYGLLGDEFAAGLHALSISALTPAEAAARQ